MFENHPLSERQATLIKHALTTPFLRTFNSIFHMFISPRTRNLHKYRNKCTAKVSRNVWGINISLYCTGEIVQRLLSSGTYDAAGIALRIHGAAWNVHKQY